ncbi:methionyl-tRNA synthetase [Desulfonatronum thiosulfatophilum]|uniref:Methionine--tRNA ligase n=1 Tax=Desulfonatronum thiosulfatophilum TaxID=617002 RepID=A0A1G6E126_9BACT|nr:methionine--tRNA ligase [Desulfonatronum thiosulfatophilum]SDB51078.1 methionyl-tRNA synthetase [Desulfonatronum thiosulfatophilum]
MQSFFLSTPIYYVNAKPHLGHAYTTAVADSMIRFQKLMGRDTFFLTGTDEHGDKIVQAAEAHAETPQAYVDMISARFRSLWGELGYEHDDFIRTTEPRHVRTVQRFLQLIYDRGDIYHGEYGGHYCFGCERFYTEKELRDGLCPDHLTAPEFIQEKNYFFRMSKYLGPLREHIEANPDFIRPERYRNEVLGLLREDLGDLCISRPKSRLSWGIELPFDTDYVTYVWFDALLNYISALEWPEGERFQRFWPQAQHLVAKDILKPHAIFWPCMLLSAGVPLYRHLNVHGYWLVQDTKMSKSLGNVVEPLDFAKKYGRGPFRYFLLREMQFGQDANVSEDALRVRFNADLANDLGNLFSRVLSMTHKYFQGKAPAPGPISQTEEDLHVLASECLENFQAHFQRFQFSMALESLWTLVRALNKYVDASQPWTLFKEQRSDELGTVMYTLLEGMRKIAVHLWPVMPEESETMLAQLGERRSAKLWPHLADEVLRWGALEPGTEVAQSSSLFPRLETAKSAQGRDENAAAPKSGKSKSKIADGSSGSGTVASEVAKAVEPTPELMEFADFQRLDLRVGTVLSAEPVKGADKLLHLHVDLAEPEARSIVAGIAEYWKPDDLIGRQVVVVANLKPRKLRGAMSQGMVLAVHSPEGLRLLAPSNQVPPGSKVS